MKNLSEIEATVALLPENDFAKLRQWFWEYENEKWDTRIEKDIAAKKLDGGSLKSKQICHIEFIEMFTDLFASVCNISINSI